MAALVTCTMGEILSSRVQLREETGRWGQRKGVSYRHGMARPQVTDGADGLPMWKVAVNVFDDESRTVDKGWSSR